MEWMKDKLVEVLWSSPVCAAAFVIYVLLYHHSSSDILSNPCQDVDRRSRGPVRRL